MHHKLISTGLVLAALLAPALSGCKYDQSNVREARKDYGELKRSGGVPDYKKTGDSTIDGIMSLPVKQAHQFQLEFDRWAAAADASPIVAKFDGKSPEDVEKDIKAMKPDERKAIEEAIAASRKEQTAQLKTLGSQAADVSKGIADAILKVQAASKGNAAGVGGLLSTGATLLSGPGGEAISQAKTAMRFCDMATTMIEDFKRQSNVVDEVIKRNSDKQATGR